ncbi:hypothetical protein FRC04_009300 [Tulasnella sp. 424]|nr:hypothetical protein FRC04_009300 [Tulasnella sp. 424]KAG8973118.1 hypothetical protein FRC05_009128 [Tulasnella sp. 425]
MRRGDDPEYRGQEGDKLWLGDHERAKFTSPHTYPAYDSSGKMVSIKTVPVYSGDSQKYAIWRMLDSPEARSHADNYTVPPTYTHLFVVMDQFDKVTQPLDAPLTDPGYPFVGTVDDLCHFFLQIAQAVRYMHDLGVAHLDIMDKNFAGSDEHPPPMILVDAEAPEAARPKKTYDPFPVDVFCIGTTFNKMVNAFEITGWTSLDELDNLAESMREDDPQQRPPTIHDVEKHLQSLIKA